MKKTIFRYIGIILMCVFTVVNFYARPRTSVKNTVVREENPRGSKSSLVLPYAFSTDSLGFTLGVGGALKGCGQEQLLLGATAFGSFDGAVGTIKEC